MRALLEAADSADTRPEDMDPRDGLKDDGYQLSEAQAQEILAMRLHRLTGLEQEKLSDEYRDILEAIRGLIAILMDADQLLDVIREELAAINEEYGDDRRTEIRHSLDDLDALDLIAPEDMVVTLSHTGYVKRQPVSIYRAQRRGGKGRSASALKDEDVVEQMWVVNTHDTLLVFTGTGRVYWLKVYQIPEAGPHARGKPIVNLLPLDEDEVVQAVLPVREYDDDQFVFFATRHGKVKKTPLTEFAYQLQRGKIAIGLADDDALVNVRLTDGDSDVMLFASNGKVVRFRESAVRSMGRTAGGVRGIKLADSAEVVAVIIAPEEAEQDIDILFATERGYGKRTPLAEFPIKGRGIQGVVGIKCSERNGSLAAALRVTEEDEVMLISDQGTLVRTRVAEISQLGRNTQGVTLMRVPDDETLITVVRLDADEEGNEDDAQTGTDTSDDTGAAQADSGAEDGTAAAGDD